MDKRIKITESQFDRLFTEDTNPLLVFQDLEIGDSIYVTEKNGSHSFQVTDDLGNAVKLASLDQKSTKTGWNYIVSKVEAIQDTDIKLQKISKKDKETKQNYTIKDVVTVKVFDKSNVEKESITIGEPEGNTNLPATNTNAVNRAGDEADTEEDKQENIIDIIDIFNSLPPQTYHIFEIDDNTNIIFKVLTIKKDVEVTIQIIAGTGANGEKYDKFKGKKFRVPLNQESITLSSMGSGWFNINIVGENNVMNTISDISDFVAYDGELPDDGKEDGGDEEEVVEKKKKKKDKYTLEKYLQQFPEIAAALHHQPKLFGLFDAGDPTGIAAVNNVVDKYENMVNLKKFKYRKKVKFEVLNYDVVINVPTAPKLKWAVGDENTMIVISKSKKKVTLSNSATAKNRIEVEILDKVGKDEYTARFIAVTQHKETGKLDKTNRKTGTIRVIDYDAM